MLLEASLDFGTVQVGQSFERTFRMYNTGNAIMTISGMTVTGAGGGCCYSVDLQTRQLMPGTSRVVTLTFRPKAPISYSGSITVNADQTAGTNTLPISAKG